MDMKELYREYDEEDNLIKLECSKCHEIKTVDYFFKNRSKKDGVGIECKQCYIERDRRYRENNKEKISEKNRLYYKDNKKEIKERHRQYRENNKDKIKGYTHKRRALKLGNGGSYTKAQWLDTLEYFDYKCAYTGECIKHNCHVEHIVPISKGGTSYIWNLVPSTASANLSKQNRDMEEWYREQEYFCEERLNKIYEYQKYMAAKYK